MKTCGIFKGGGINHFFTCDTDDWRIRASANHETAQKPAAKAAKPAAKKAAGKAKTKATADEA